MISENKLLELFSQKIREIINLVPYNETVDIELGIARITEEYVRSRTNGDVVLFIGVQGTDFDRSINRYARVTLVMHVLYANPGSRSSRKLDNRDKKCLAVAASIRAVASRAVLESNDFGTISELRSEPVIEGVAGDKLGASVWRIRMELAEVRMYVPQNELDAARSLEQALKLGIVEYETPGVELQELKVTICEKGKKLTDVTVTKGN